MDFKGILRSILRITIPLLIGAVLLWFIYRKIDFTDVLEIIRTGVRYDILFASLIFGLLANLARAFRWRLLIHSLGEKPRSINLVFAVLGNYTVNLVLPRMGEIWRCGVIKKYDHVSFTKLLGTLVVDRVSDLVAVGLITASIVLFNFTFFIDFLNANPDLLGGIQSIVYSKWFYILLGTVVLTIYLIFTQMKHVSFVMKIRILLKNVTEGVMTIWYLKKKSLFTLYTLLIWFGYFLFFYITFYAFDFTKELGVAIGLITFTMSSIAVAVPVQGAIGPWHFMVIATLVVFGVSPNDAAAFALIVHTTQTAFTALVGLVGIVALPLINQNK